MSIGERLREFRPQLAAAIPMWMLWLAALAIMLTVIESLDLSAAQTSSWIMILFGLPALLSIVLSVRYRVPLVFTPHILALILFGSLAAEISFPEMVGASMIAGALVLILGVTGVTGLVTSWIPGAVVMAMIAGVVVPFVADMFTSLGTDSFVVGSALVAYVVSRRYFGKRISPIIPALVVGVIAVGLTGRFGEPLPALRLPDPILIPPEFSLEAVVAIVPVLIVLMTLQTNIPSVIYLREQGYDPPERLINAACGGSTALGALFGPIAVSIALGQIPVVGGPEAGPLEDRHRAASAASVLPLLLALGATLAAPLARFVPSALIFTVAGLALIGVLLTSLEDAVRGPLRLGPVAAFAIVLSDISLLGLGPIFWSLVLGSAVSFVLEREGWAQIGEATA
ncbi:MAG: benzoate/H(+) symporter BenE family transporter [Anaerolineales bacterium]|nr:benzoate/H(+) symporter BenE family transporter [Anaerolineales bacterium]